MFVISIHNAFCFPNICLFIIPAFKERFRITPEYVNTFSSFSKKVQNFLDMQKKYLYFKSGSIFSVYGNMDIHMI